MSVDIEKALEQKHNEYSKNFLRKLLNFADVVITGAYHLSTEEKDKFIIKNLLTLKDAINSELIFDAVVLDIKTQITDHQKKQEMIATSQEDLNQEVASDKDRKA